MKVYDCFPFFNELEVLELRLNELDPVVDKFVLVEATRTFQNKEKPLYFNENKERFEKFKDKIIHIIVDKYPKKISSLWVLQDYQRNKIMEGLVDCKPDDVIIISDVDEIPKPEKIVSNKDTDSIKIFTGRWFYYFLNFVLKNGVFAGPVMIKYKYLTTPKNLVNLRVFCDTEILLLISCLKRMVLNPTFLISYLKGMVLNPTFLSNLKRMLLNPAFLISCLKRMYSKLKRLWVYLICKLVIYKLKKLRVKIVKDAFWHFSYLGGVQRIIKKLEAIPETLYYNKHIKDFKSEKRIEEAIRSRRDLVGLNFEFEPVPIDETFPKYLRENISKFSHLIYPLDKNSNKTKNEQ